MRCASGRSAVIVITPGRACCCEPRPGELETQSEVLKCCKLPTNHKKQRTTHQHQRKRKRKKGKRKEKEKERMNSSKNIKETNSETEEELSPIITSYDPTPLLHGGPTTAAAAAAGPTGQAAQQDHHHYHPPAKQGQTNWKSDTRKFRIQGWDPVLIISQILAIQALHYLLLSLITPPLLRAFARPDQLELEGGSQNVAMIIDWRAMSGATTLHSPHAHRLDGAAGFGRLPNSLGRKPFRIGNRLPSLLNHPPNPQHSHLNSSTPDSSADPGLLDKISRGLGPDWVPQNLNYSARHAELYYDSNRSWVISSAWLISSLIGVIILYEIVRRPKQIMDHSLTICLNHLILSTYYSAHLPSSLWFYFVLLLSAVLQILLTEHLCVRREFRDGLGVGWKVDHRPDDS
ncbi:hypothetical protein PGT21_016946 [Puccinia graminis f. sp. tritici]|uniref:Integral membrane protein n=1 Tax=Puccinia graminis f. sp. tritici TaxID=56615 RepID=A0A5B0LS29_PUCGR|nr:hypothetical protein PGT21_016946 [Puccinia graminis f. sp. tritici]KAA1093469.1 hypothetical protein PGTUg99_019957 [Puccinia graminis f. sp. tritici]